MLLESLTHNKSLQALDVSTNHVRKVKNLVGRESELTVTFGYIKTCFRCLKEFAPAKLVVNDWLLDYLEYPDSLADCLKETLSVLNDKRVTSFDNSTMQ